jgi:uridine phosphorylase
MGRHISETELILNADGSIYHLQTRPGEVANTILLVGDPHRVSKISRRFDRIEFTKESRELITHTGYIGSRRISCISTGMGTDNIDIVLNELDALFNIDLETRMVKDQLESLNIIRLGTSGSLHKDIEVDSLLASHYAVGLDSLMNYYQRDITSVESRIENDMNALEFMASNSMKAYVAKGSDKLINTFGEYFQPGITATCVGFYGPQGRLLRAEGNEVSKSLIEHLNSVKISVAPHRITNFEMETAGIYGMASLLGHEAISLNAILANRASHQFSKDPAKTIEKMIDHCFSQIEQVTHTH